LMGEQAEAAGMQLAERLRDEVPGISLVTHCGGGSFKSQFKKADRSGARYALILGEEEVRRGVVGVKALREESEQQELALEQLPGFFASAVLERIP
ncbi:MAG: hypothetical protein B0D86_05560, partial [Candidatus Sedimenticola endophacoides]